MRGFKARREGEKARVWRERESERKEKGREEEQRKEEIRKVRKSHYEKFTLFATRGRSNCFADEGIFVYILRSV